MEKRAENTDPLNCLEYFGFPKNTEKVDCRHIRSGECEVYSIVENKQKMFLKVKENSQVSFESEAFALKNLANLGAKVSVVIRQKDDFIITTENRGVSFKNRPHLFSKKKIYENLSVDIQKFYLIKFNGFGPIENTHRLKCRYAKWIDFFEDVSLWMQTVRDRYPIAIKSVEVLEEYWQKNSSKLNNVKKSNLVHGDFCLDHIFAFKRSYSGIIDFGDAFAGDPLMDLAYFKLKEINKPYGLKTFELLQKSLHKYQRIGPEEMTLINLYMIYWAFRRVTESRDADMASTFLKKLEKLSESLGLVA